MDRSKITKGVVATILRDYGGFYNINDVVVSGQNIVISQSGTAIDYVDVSCSGNVTALQCLEAMSECMIAW